VTAHPPAAVPATRSTAGRGGDGGPAPTALAPVSNRHRVVLLVATAALVLVAAVVSIMVGAYTIPVGDVLAVLAAKAGSPTAPTA